MMTFLYTVFQHPFLCLAAWLALSVPVGVLVGRAIRFGGPTQ